VRVADILEPATELAAAMAAFEAEEAHASPTRAQATYGAASSRILVLVADRALYSAKGRGRNRVELFESRPTPRRPTGRTKGRWSGPR